MFHFLKSCRISLLLKPRFLASIHQIAFGDLASPGSAGGAKALPQAPSRNKGAYIEGKRYGWGEEKEGRGKEG